MKLFVLGPSRSGKTPFATRLATALNAQHIGASAWVRERFAKQAPEFPSREAFVAAITAFSLERLRAEPSSCVGFLESRYDLAKPSVIEGVRNPYDFVHLFDPREDRAAFLDLAGNPLPPTDFESGLGVIADYLGWLERTGLMPPGRVLRYAFRRFWPADPPSGEAPFETFDDALAHAEAALKPAFAAPALEAARQARVHQEIEPIPVLVREEVLYNFDPAKAGGWVEAHAFALSCYQGHAPCFSLRIDSDGALFSYVPPHLVRLRGKPPASPELELADLAYLNCPSSTFCAHRFRYLDGPVLAYLKRRDLWLPGTYRLTLEWYEGNDLLHLVLLDQGQLAFLPHHKLKFGNDSQGFRPYKKLRREWKV